MPANRFNSGRSGLTSTYWSVHSRFRDSCVAWVFTTVGALQSGSSHFHHCQRERLASCVTKRISPASRRFEIQSFDEFIRFLGSVLPVHAAVLPLHGQRALVANIVQCTDKRFPVDPAVTGGTEIPASPRV